MEDSCRWFDNIEGLLNESDRTMPNASVIRLKGTHWLPGGDTYCYIQENFKEYKWLIVPALKDETLENTNEITYIQNPEVGHDESNWPQRNSTEHYIEMRANPETRMKFWTQHQNNPQKSTEATKIDPKWLRYYCFEPRPDGIYIVCNDDGEEFLLGSIPKYGIIDPGGFAETKMIKKGSNNAFIIGGQSRNSIKKFITFAFAGKMKDPSIFKQQVYDAHGEQSPQHWRIEVFGQQGYIMLDLQKDENKPPGFRIWDCPSDVGRDAKDLRMQALIPVARNGELYIHENMTKLKGELLNYPGGMTFDLFDCVGWLNQLYWTRQPKSDTIALNRKKRIRFATQGTGY